MKKKDNANTEKHLFFWNCSNLITISLLCIFLLPIKNFYKKYLDCDSSLMNGYPLSTSGSLTYSTFLKHYYDNLTHNFGMNYDSSCGYVGLGMLLSYYDTFYDSDLIASNYDVKSTGIDGNVISRRNSPGILHDDFSNTGFYSVYGDSYPGANLYLSYCIQIHQFSLHARLIEIGNTLGYIDISSSQAFATNLNQRKNILDYYLQNDVGLTTSDYSITYYGYNPLYYDGQQSSLASTIRSLIDSGHAVAVGISQPGPYGATGHVVIAYDYSWISQPYSFTLYFHPGLSHTGFSTHMTLNQMGYSLIKSYMAIDFNYSASPGYNYEISNNNYQYNSSLINWTGSN